MAYTRDHIMQTVLTEMRDYTGNKIEPMDTFEEVDYDSLDIVELVTEIEDKLSIDIPDSVWDSDTKNAEDLTINEFVDNIMRELR